MSEHLQDITSGDSHRIWKSACAIATLRDIQELELLAAHLPEIEKATKGIDLGGALFPNQKHLEFALHKLRYFKSKAGCLCRLYPDRLMFNPAREQESGNIRILETIRGDQWNDSYACQCAFCGTVFRVEEGEYHYTWWKWEVAE
ncbi:MAG: hypothetical protein EOP04_14900 [Proteobacteria bacterium]|nr:MAG: hypothetical protein EOP04_14900 [Pseudomonadota bacterium]